jgi:hypothetical protein
MHPLSSWLLAIAELPSYAYTVCISRIWGQPPFSMALQEPENPTTWSAVHLAGEANSVFDAYNRVAKEVDEVDDCVLAVNIDRVRICACWRGFTTPPRATIV